MIRVFLSHKEKMSQAEFENIWHERYNVYRGKVPKNPSQFTFSLNASTYLEPDLISNCSSQEGLRMSMWDECEGRDVNRAATEGAENGWWSRSGGRSEMVVALGMVPQPLY